MAHGGPEPAIPAISMAIETASIDELRALQTERLRWSVRHAYAWNAGNYRR